MLHVVQKEFRLPMGTKQKMKGCTTKIIVFVLAQIKEKLIQIPNRGMQAQKIRLLHGGGEACIHTPKREGEREEGR